MAAAPDQRFDDTECAEEPRQRIGDRVANESGRAIVRPRHEPAGRRTVISEGHPLASGRIAAVARDAEPHAAIAWRDLIRS